MKSMTRRRILQSASAAAAVPILANSGPARAQAPQESEDGIRIEEDIVFAKGGDIDLPLDVFHPAPGTSKRMAIVHVHGGGFFAGDKGLVAVSARMFARQGYTGIASSYRLQGQAKWPAQIEDVKAAIRWTRANAERLEIDADKIAVAGYSAGGMLALFAAGTNGRPEFEGTGGFDNVSSEVAACVAFYAAPRATPGLFPEGEATEEAIAAASPTSLIGPDFAPTIFLHGVADTTIPYTSSVDFFNGLHEAGVKVDLHLLQGAPHAFERPSPDAALASAEISNLFLDRVVVNPRDYPPFRFPGARGRQPG